MIVGTFFIVMMIVFLLAIIAIMTDSTVIMQIAGVFFCILILCVIALVIYSVKYLN